MDNNVCSELGIYGVILSNGDKRSMQINSNDCKDDAHCKDVYTSNKALKEDDDIEKHSSQTFVCNKAVGYLVRSKASNM